MSYRSWLQRNAHIWVPGAIYCLCIAGLLLTSSSYRSELQRNALLWFLGAIYGLSMVTLLLWTAGCVLMFCALAQPDPPSDHIDNSLSRARLKKALFWLFDFDPTPRTFRIAEMILFVHCLIAFPLTVVFPPANYSWKGWIFVQHTIGIAIDLVAAFAVVTYWLRHLPKGQTRSQACHRCFEPKDTKH